jgi:hypothetical protein
MALMQAVRQRDESAAGRSGSDRSLLPPKIDEFGLEQVYAIPS